MDFIYMVWDKICGFVDAYVLRQFSRMQWRDVVDILILAVILYAVYRFARERRAGRVLFGLMAVVLFFVLVSAVELPVLSAFAKILASSAFFCIVLIFQPEIRDGLERIGNSRVLYPLSDTMPRRRLPAARQMTDELVDAVFCMSNSCTGALIVLEGLTSLGEYAEGGKPVDARVTSHLLQNIFFDKAPLHDGALIIRDMRIWRASCVLPSTNSKDDFGNMGTRHRAAVGLTEVSDSLVIVVSEQTGIVSVAQDGRLIRGVDRESLKDIILTYMAGSLYLRTKRQEARAARIASEMAARAEQAAAEQIAVEQSRRSASAAEEEPDADPSADSPRENGQENNKNA
ncbi:MAG: TIGR00159 family protein [Ruminococcaceae bacterium]|nr:TIGR00159 family protein [Oscillospiraceae bacterium]